MATALLEAKADVRIKLLYANQSPDDILCQQARDVRTRTRTRALTRALTRASHQPPP